MRRIRRTMLIGLAFVAACRDNNPPEPTAAESRQLNEAEDMLNGLAQNEEGPEDRSPGPSNASN